MTANPTILVVEDDAFVRDIFQRSLERAGYDVLTAAHGEEALASFRKGGIGLVVTDILMPELDGFRLTRALKREAPSLPVIAISVINDVSDSRALVIAAGATLAVCKPVNPHELVKLVKQFISPQPLQ